MTSAKSPQVRLQHILDETNGSRTKAGGLQFDTIKPSASPACS